MLRMEITLFLVVAFVAYMYFTAEKEHTALHKTFSVLRWWRCWCIWRWTAAPSTPSTIWTPCRCS